MPRRKISQTDVDQAYALASEAKKSALFSMRRAKQLKDGADKLKKDFNNNKKKDAKHKPWKRR